MDTSFSNQYAAASINDGDKITAIIMLHLFVLITFANISVGVHIINALINEEMHKKPHRILACHIYPTSQLNH